MKRLATTILAVASLAAFPQSFTATNGQLKIVGHQLCNQAGKPVQLVGFSTHNTTYCPECVTREAIKSNCDFWGVNVVRAAIYDDDFWNENSYNKNPALSMAMVDSLVRWSEQLGIYCIIDWHILTQGNPDAKVHAGADAFFREVSARYAGKPHVLYEICNEPNGKGVTWDTIARYANRVIPIIRENAPASIVIVGTPNWCQLLDQVVPARLADTTNVMYAFHFYAASHASLLPLFLAQVHRIPVFATEWGTCENTGNGNVNFDVAGQYVAAMRQHVLGADTVSVSWCNFSYGDKKEAASALKPNSCKLQRWDNMTPSGFFVRDCMLGR